MFKLSKSEFRGLSAVFVASGQVFFGAAIAAFVVPIDDGKLVVILFELGFTALSWGLSVLSAGRGKL